MFKLMGMKIFTILQFKVSISEPMLSMYVFIGFQSKWSQNGFNQIRTYMYCAFKRIISFTNDNLYITSHYIALTLTIIYCFVLLLYGQRIISVTNGNLYITSHYIALTLTIIYCFVLLLYVPSQQLWSWLLVMVSSPNHIFS